MSSKVPLSLAAEQAPEVEGKFTVGSLLLLFTRRDGAVYTSNSWQIFGFVWKVGSNVEISGDGATFQPDKSFLDGDSLARELDRLVIELLLITGGILTIVESGGCGSEFEKCVDVETLGSTA